MVKHERSIRLPSAWRIDMEYLWLLTSYCVVMALTGNAYLGLVWMTTGIIAIVVTRKMYRDN